MSVAAPLVLREDDRGRLVALARSTSVQAGLAHRARIVLLAAEGLTNTEIARWTGSTRPTVINWRNRYATGGIDALRDRPRSGRPVEVNELEVVATTLADGGRPPEQLGARHWSARLLGSELGISYATVARIWRKWGIQPHQVETFTFSPDLALDAQVRGSAGAQPDHADSAAAQHGSGPDGSAGPQPADHPDPWLNLVEVSLAITTHQAIRRGTYASVHHLIEALGALTDGWRDRPEPAHRTGAGADSSVLAKTDRKATSNTHKRSSQVENGPPRGSDRPVDRPVDRPAGHPRDGMSRDGVSLRTEFHGSRSRWSGPTATDAGG